MNDNRIKVMKGSKETKSDFSYLEGKIVESNLVLKSSDWNVNKGVSWLGVDLVLEVEGEELVKLTAVYLPCRATLTTIDGEKVAEAKVDLTGKFTGLLIELGVISYRESLSLQISNDLKDLISLVESFIGKSFTLNIETETTVETTFSFGNGIKLETSKRRDYDKTRASSISNV